MASCCWCSSVHGYMEARRGSYQPRRIYRSYRYHQRCAAPALATILRMWESEQTIEIDNIGVQLENERTLDSLRKDHIIEMEKSQMVHAHSLATSAQEHQQIVEKHKETIVKLTPIHKMGKEE